VQEEHVAVTGDARVLVILVVAAALAVQNENGKGSTGAARINDTVFRVFSKM
jgi:hypothetical protein